MYSNYHRINTIKQNTVVAVDTTVGGIEVAPARTGKESRKQCILTNTGAVVVYVALGFNPTSSAYTYQMAAGSTLVLPIGINTQIKAIAASSSANVRVFEGV